MSWLKFISAMTDSLAWPGAAFAIAFIFRTQIRELIHRIKQVGFGGATVTLVPELLDEAERAAEALPAAQPEPEQQRLTDQSGKPIIAPRETDVVCGQHPAGRGGGRANPTKDDVMSYLTYVPSYRDKQFQALLSISPNAAVVDAWSNIERMVSNIGAVHGINSPSGGALRLATELALADILPGSILTLLSELNVIRNQAAHSRKVSAEDALRFYGLANRVMNFLEELDKDNTPT